MTPTSYWIWTYWDPIRKRRTRTRYQLTEAEALARLEQPERVPGTERVIDVADTIDESWAARYGPAGHYRT